MGDNPDEKRARIKKLVLTLLFDDDDEIYNRQEDSAVNIFRREFPSIARAFSYIKSFGYNNLAILLQRIESFLLLGFVCRRISVQRPELPLFTIHDSIVTTAGNEGYIQAVMHEELYRIMGAAPQFKVEYWKRPIPVVELIVQRVSYLTWLELYRA